MRFKKDIARALAFIMLGTTMMTSFTSCEDPDFGMSIIDSLEAPITSRFVESARINEALYTQNIISANQHDEVRRKIGYKQNSVHKDDTGNWVCDYDSNQTKSVMWAWNNLKDECANSEVADGTFGKADAESEWRIGVLNALENISSTIQSDDLNLAKACIAIRPIGMNGKVADSTQENLDKVYNDRNKGSNNTSILGISKYSDLENFDPASKPESRYLSNFMMWYRIKESNGTLHTIFDSQLDSVTPGTWYFKDLIGKPYEINTMGGVGISAGPGGLPLLESVANSEFKNEKIFDYDKVNDPIHIVPNDYLAELEKALEYPVYVLDYSTFDQSKIPSAGEVMTNINNIVNTADGNGINIDELNKYFSPAYKATETGSSGVLSLGDLIPNQSLGSIVHNSSWNADGVNKNGKDLIIYADGDGADQKEPIMALRVNEFDDVACGVLNSVLGIFNYDYESQVGRYLVATPGNSTTDTPIIYLMEYPIKAMQGFTISSTDNSKVDANLTDSGLGFNVLSGTIIKYDTTNNGDILASGEYIDLNAQNDSVYTLMSSDDSNMSVANLGTDIVTFGFDDGVIDTRPLTEQIEGGTASGSSSTEKFDVYAANFVLLDYLEGTYAPDYNTNDSRIVVFGRKMRFYKYSLVTKKSFQGSGDGLATHNIKSIQFPLTENCIKYVNTDGGPLGTWAATMGISDLCDIDGLAKNNKVKSIASIQTIDTSQSSNSNGTTVLNPDNSVEKSDAIKNTASKIADITELAHERYRAPGDTIITSTMFPGKNLGKVDFDIELNTEDKSLKSRPRFWVMTTKQSMFQNGIIENWIVSQEVNNSLQQERKLDLDWWIRYLKAKDFSYTFENSKVETYLIDNYKAQLQSIDIVGEDGILINEEAVKGINELYKKEHDNTVRHIIRSIFIVVGWSVICLAFLIAVLWVLDTNTDLGVNSLNKITFGHWYAVKYESDIPSNRVGSSVTYVSAQGLIIKCLILITIGILLIVVDVFVLASAVISMFGKIASLIEHVIKGA